MRAVVTGHKGYIGSHLYKALLEDDACTRLVGLDLKDNMDIRRSLPKENFDTVFHFAANPRVGYSVEHPSQTLNDNVYATSVLLEWAKDHGVKRVIFSSSSAVLGQGDGIPTSPYGLHKLQSEMEMRLYAKLYGLDSVCLRYFNVYSKDQPFGGSYSTAICAWYSLMKEGKSLRMDGTGEQTRDFIHVDDVVSANLHFASLEGKFEGMGIEIGTGTSMSLTEIKDIIDNNHEVNWEFAPPREGDVLHTKANTSIAKSYGWEAKIMPREGIEAIFKKEDK
jgi:UDP-glucose 4-epimerase